MEKTVAIIFGGVSTEHDVSLVSVTSVIKNFPTEEYEYVLIGITKDGRWLLFSGDVDKIATGEWVNDEDNRQAFIPADRSVHGIVVPSLGQEIYLDAVFPVMHGINGEDGTIQGLLQLADIPVVGCGMTSSAICMDKILTKTVLGYNNIPQAKWYGFTKDFYLKNRDEVINEIEKLGYPTFIKPANAGSSVGINKATDRDSLLRAIDDALMIDSRIVAEEGIDGSEIECAVLGNEDAEVSCCGEIVPANDFYDFEAKYHNDNSLLYIPARISEEKANEVRSQALKAYHILGCRGLARMDFFVRKSDGAVLLNEPNTLPGFTSISMYSKLWDASGVEYKELIKRLIEAALN